MLTVLDIGISTATDNVDFMITNNAPSSFPLGTTIVTWTVSDSSENTVSDTQIITIQDTTPPTTSLQNNAFRSFFFLDSSLLQGVVFRGEMTY